MAKEDIQPSVHAGLCMEKRDGQRRVVAKGVGGDYSVFALPLVSALGLLALGLGGVLGGVWKVRAYWVVPCMPTHLLAAQQREGPLHQ